MRYEPGESEKAGKLKARLEELAAINEALRHEVAERRRLEEAVARREAEARLIMDNIPNLVSILKPDGTPELINRQILAYTGKTEGELKGWRAGDLVHPDDRSRAGDSVRNGIASGEPYDIVYRMRRHDGIYRWFHAHHHPLKDADGTVVRWCVSVIDIDDRRRAEDALRESENSARALMDGIPGFVAVLAADGSVEMVNRRIIEYCGSSLEELKDWGTNGTVHPDDVPHVAGIFLPAIAAGIPYEIEQRIRRHDGAYRWFGNRGIPIHDSSGGVSHWYVLLTDVDARRRAEDALRESETRLAAAEHDLRQTIDTIPVLIATYTPDGKRTFVNQTWQDYTGLSPEAATADRAAAFPHFHPDDVERNEKAWRAARERGEPLAIELRVRRADGHYRWHMARRVPLRDERGQIVRWYSIGVDIEDQKRADQVLRETEQQLRLIVNSIPGLVAVFAPNGDAEELNQQFLAYLGQTFEEFATNWATNGTVHPDDLERHVATLSQSLTSGEAIDFETRLRRFDGDYRWFQLRGHPVRNSNGRIARWYCLMTDIDERKQAETDLAREKQLMEMIATGASLHDVLNGLCKLIEEAAPDCYCDVHPIDWSGPTFRYGVAPSMPASYTAPIAGLAVSPALLPCGIAAHENKQVIAEDMESDPRWLASHVRTHALKYGVRAVWSTPICAKAGNVLGTFCVYQRRPGTPSARHQSLIAHATHIASVAIEKSRAEEALAASEQNLQVTVDTIPALAWSARPDGSADFFNAHYLAYVGLSTAEANGWGWTVAVHPDDMPGLAATWQSILASGKAGEAEARLRRHDGEYRWLLFRANPLRDEKGEIVRWYGVNTDIEDRKRADAELRRSHDSFAAAQRLSKTGNFTADVVADEHIWSEELYRIFEFEPDKKISVQDVRAILHPEDLPAFDAGFQRSAAEGIDFDQIFRIVTSAGAVKYLHARARVIETVENRPVFIGAIRDVTESRLAEEALDKTRSELAHVARVTSLSHLTASIAHEVNQPLSGIITNASTSVRMLTANPPNVEGALETARRTIRDGNRASEVVTRLRALFSKRSVTTEVVNLGEAAQEVVALSLVDLRRNGVSVRTDLAEGLPAVSGDRVQLQQVILNLLLNASDAMSAVTDGPRQVVIETGRDEAGNVQLRVRDSGMGIAPEAAARLFDAFYTTKATGMGIGLSVSRSIVERHGGRIWAETNNRGGATFSFSIPPRSGGDPGSRADNTRPSPGHSGGQGI